LRSLGDRAFNLIELEKINQLMDRSKFIAIVTGAISLILAIGYLLLVQLLDFRGEMIPAPQSYFFVPTQAVQVRVAIQSETFDPFMG
jgi:hypothetical protein